MSNINFIRQFVRDNPNCLFFLSLTILFVCGCNSSVWGQSQNHLFTESKPTGNGPTEPRELGNFLDAIIVKEMKKRHIPGVVFVLVKDGEIFLSKGYGFADLDKKKPVVPAKTLFRVASVSKTITATAVMQLYDRGLIDLHDNVNDYLTKFKLPNTFSTPVTFHHLLTHTGGFDDYRIGLATLQKSEVPALGEYLAQNMPPRVIPPGEQYSYSRHGIALAGYLVEVISGIPFAQYVEKNILQPLGMNCSSFELPDELAPDLAVGYKYEHGRYEVVPYHYFKTAPEASFNATGVDMAKFMIAHLQGGQYQGERILSDATAQLMHQRIFAHHPKLEGITYGFYERLENNQRAIQHGGHIPGFVSRILMLPEHNLGFFISCNNDEFGLISEVTDQFFNHYYPVSKGNSNAPQKISDDLSRFAGFYLRNDYSRNSLEKVMTLLRQFRIREDNAHGLLYEGKHKWQEVEPGLFQRKDNGEYSFFKENKQDKVKLWFEGRFAYEKLGFFASVPFHIGMLGSMILIFVSGFLIWPAEHLWRTKNGTTEANQFGFSQRLSGIVSFLNLVFIFGMSWFVIRFDKITDFTFGVPAEVIFLLCIPLLSLLLTMTMLYFNVKIWKEKSFSPFYRLHYTFVSLTAVSFLFFLHYWNLLGFRF